MAALKHVPEYRQHALECRGLAKRAPGEEERAQLLEIAQIWESMGPRECEDPLAEAERHVHAGAQHIDGLKALIDLLESEGHAGPVRKRRDCSRHSRRVSASTSSTSKSSVPSGKTITLRRGGPSLPMGERLTVPFIAHERRKMDISRGADGSWS